MHIWRAGWEKSPFAGHAHSSRTFHLSQCIRFGRQNFANSPVHIQWDTERSLRGAGLNHFSIQVGIGRQMIREYVDQWIVKIEDLTSTVSKIRDLLKAGDEKSAKRSLPPERVYPIEPRIADRILIQ